MNDRNSKTMPEEPAGPATPEDVAILYSWANLPGAKYRDFSASRREYRAQQRARQAEEQRQAELDRARMLEEAARREMEEATRALEGAHRQKREAADVETERRAEDAFRQAEANASREREEAGRRQQSAETLRLRALSARREMEEARRRAEDQAARYAEFDAQYRAQVEAREADLPGQLDDPYYYTGQVDPAYFASTPGVRTAQATRTSTERKAYVFPVHPGSDEFDAGTLQAYRPGTNFAPSPAQEFRSSGRVRDFASTEEQAFERTQPAEQERRTGRDPEDTRNAVADNDYYSNSGRSLDAQPSGTTPIAAFQPPGLRDLHIRPRTEEPRYEERVERPLPSALPVDRRADGRGQRTASVDPRARTTRYARPDQGLLPETEMELSAMAGMHPPAWIDPRLRTATVETSSYGAMTPAAAFSPHLDADTVGMALDRVAGDVCDEVKEGNAAWAADTDAATPPPPLAPDTLQQSRERVASRWFALQGLMDQEPLRPAAKPSPALPTGAPMASDVPMIAVVSLSGGVGKTSLVATLGRALSSLGEKVLLADTNTHGLLPYYFGARDLRPGAVRTFTPPAGSADAPVLMVHYDLEAVGRDEAAQDRLFADLIGRAEGAQRVLVDLSGHALWLGRRLTALSPFVLVPLVADMNSILSTRAMEATFAEMRDGDGQTVRPYYVLNQYDPAQPLHLDVREVLRRSLGDRLLPVMIHRTEAVSEALAEGMTIVDYAPDSAVTEDYRGLAQWMQGLASPGSASAPGARWSER